MKELKFKLKLNGKCVGYMRIKDGEVEVAYPNYIVNPLWRKQYNAGLSGGCGYVDGAVLDKEIDFGSIHPFVCPDRNGKDVYEGDWVLERGEKWQVQWFCRGDIELIPDEVPE